MTLGQRPNQRRWAWGRRRSAWAATGVTEALKSVQGQTQASLAIGAGAFIQLAATLEGEEGLDLADHRAARATRMEHLVKETPESAAQGKDPLPAVGPLVGWGQEPAGEVGAEEVFEMVEAVLAHGLESASAGGEAGTPGGEVWCIHN